MILEAPACANDPGSWCERIWNLWSVEWLAQAADVILAPGLRILIVIGVALLVRILAHRAIDRLTRLSAVGVGPRSWKPWRDRVESIALGDGSVVRRRERAESIGSLLKSVSSFVIVVVAFILILAELGINVAPLLASAGIAGVALGFGAQNLVRDFLAGVAIILEDQLGLGDSVDLGPAAGTVVAVGLRTTTVRGADGTIWYVRNGEILRVGNSSQGDPIVTVDIPLPFDVDTGAATRVALEAATDVAGSETFADRVITGPTAQGLTAMTHDVVTTRLSATVLPGTQAEFARVVRAAVKDAFDREGLVTASSIRTHEAGPTEPAPSSEGSPSTATGGE